PWNATVDHPENPDYMVFDLDPGGVEFKKVIQVAQMLKIILDHLKMNSFCKTSGKTGLHIMVPTGAQFSFKQVRELSKIIFNIVHRHFPEFTSMERSPDKREGRIYLDYLQNRRGQTMACAY